MAWRQPASVAVVPSRTIVCSPASAPAGSNWTLRFVRLSYASQIWMRLSLRCAKMSGNVRMGGVMILMPAIIVGGHLAIAVADRPPVVNFGQTCRATEAGGLRINDGFETCVADEKLARDQLARQWASFDPGARARCAGMSTTGHASSYVELLTCLEMDRSARKLPGHDGTTGIFITAPERPVNERDEATYPSQSRPQPIAQPPQQPIAAVPAPAAPLSLQQPPLSAPPPEPPPSPAQAVSQDGVLHQSFCRSPLGFILPNCP
jgi:hypothetical protein